ncbi:sulfur carrier protein ThiS [Flavobacterium sp. XS2P14]|uniref:sulfur carrier protein ThiS n=1 Tax=Flavobacterium sp. XS2P14 TaxID=3401735 RepID=UPI003AAEF8EB
MELKINNQTKQFTTDSLSVQALLDLEIPEKQNGIAVAINNTVIPQSDWNSHLIQETDDILIISATQGG